MLKAELPRESCLGPCSVAFQLSTKIETPQPLWATCSGVWPPSQWVGKEGKYHFPWSAGSTLPKAAHDYRFATRAHIGLHLIWRPPDSFAKVLFSQSWFPASWLPVYTSAWCYPHQMQNLYNRPKLSAPVSYPWSTSLLTSLQLDLLLSITIFAAWHFIQFFIHLTVHFSSLYCFSLMELWETVLKAFLKLR